ncbi:hypothetical protein GGE16_002662 [Rhizobium leguminosarum]|uniref:Uncharacterized protein n=1 Tax=Rhizobium leguminosarum TaxID=384 RepID=A0AAE2SWF1_RHILE|nr:MULTISPECIES: hypothetical protein [Rhizobium]MBB4290622.1 hypothetical protein [Rhizobium leguminosarum]MBB4297327.1 hypothetical protein [Rhizobium leguminosarum]MBB4307473.1 hypothetical protein [Rhizobium leguminosarum]MBB4415247.1 hypothetical protein [Rhizobium leguminosarum]MBB4431786.1 hypothetical protein [Rhizobium esperanzae]
MSAEEINIPRVQLPRSLLGRRRSYVAAYRFRIGQLVDFHGDLAIVISRSRTAMGREHYGIVLLDAHERPARDVLGSALKHTH